jgi:hypothetical protein
MADLNVKMADVEVTPSNEVVISNPALANQVRNDPGQVASSISKHRSIDSLNASDLSVDQHGRVVIKHPGLAADVTAARAATGKRGLLGGGGPIIGGGVNIGGPDNFLCL